MARIPQESMGELCPHGFPIEFKTQCPDCKSVVKPAVEFSGVRPKINLTDAEIESLLSNIEKGQFETGEMVKFQVSESNQEQPRAVLAEEAEEAKPESNKERLQREANETAQDLADVLMKRGNILEKIEKGKSTMNEYLGMFSDDRAKAIGRRFLAAAMSELATQMSETNQAEIISAMQALGLQATKYRERKDFEG